MDEPTPLTTRSLLAELDFPVATGRRRAILERLADALQPLHALIIDVDGPHRGDGERTFAMFHLATRSISDLVASAHLASHAYLQQAYETLRPVRESCDLLELFVREPGEASRWINAEELGAKFQPSKVRKEIGSPREKADVYGHLSEMGTHPRFAGSRLSGLMRVTKNEPADHQVVLRMGPFFPEHPAAVHVYGFIFEAVIGLGFKLRLWGAKTRSGFGTRRSSALPRSIVACSAGDPWSARKRRFRAASRGSDTRRQRPRSNKGTPQASGRFWRGWQGLMLWRIVMCSERVRCYSRLTGSRIYGLSSRFEGEVTA